MDGLRQRSEIYGQVSRPCSQCDFVKTSIRASGPYVYIELDHPRLLNKDLSQQKKKLLFLLGILKSTACGPSKVRCLQFSGRNTGFVWSKTDLRSDGILKMLTDRWVAESELLHTSLMLFLKVLRIQDTKPNEWMSCPRKLIIKALVSFN